MSDDLLKFRGSHPGIALERVLRERGITKRSLALAVGTHPQTLNAVVKARRPLSVGLALQIEAYLALNEGALAELQLWYDIRKAKEAKGNIPPELKILRRSLFWDADYDTLDMDLKSSAIIRRVNERGTPEERKAVQEYYGAERVNTALAAEPGTSYGGMKP
jgi:addiction module HigA family antidote